MVPVIPTALMVRAALPLLVSVTVWAALVVFVTWLAKVKLVGLSVTPGATPEPLRATVCGLPGALDATETLALSLPLTVGVKVTLMVQVDPAARVLGLSGQVFV